jgi:hypothetical protein
MPKPKSRKKKQSKRVLALPDLEHAKTAVVNSLTSASGQRTYDHAIGEFVAWYCSEPRLAFNRTVVLRYRIHLEQRGYAPATINLRLAAVLGDWSGVLRRLDGTVTGCLSAGSSVTVSIRAQILMILTIISPPHADVASASWSGRTT